MYGNTLHTGYLKRAAGAGLFLGMLWCAGGCGKPTFSTEVTKTPIPTITEQPVPTEALVSRKPIQTPVTTRIPEATKELPFLSPVPSITVSPSPTPVSTPSPTAQPSIAPTKKPVPTPRPSITPTKIPTLTQAPSVTPTLQPTALPDSGVSPLPTALPDYVALLQNGWQKTEDFFGAREIFFSGMFDRAKIEAVSGRYEYQYASSLEEGIGFAVIGEEDAAVQQFLDELVLEYPDCRIVEEGEEDYSYTYQREKTLVMGRVYACKKGENMNRTRIEFYASIQAEGEMEGYGFYLRIKK